MFLRYLYAHHQPKTVSDDRVLYWLYDQDGVTKVIFNKLTSLANTYAYFHGAAGNMEMIELQIARYTPPGDSYAGLHRDTVPSTPRSHLRRLSISIELSGDYEGKGVVFANNENMAAGVGDAIVFNPEEWHNPAPVLKGERVSMIAWFYDSESDYLSFPTQWPDGLELHETTKVPVDLEAAFRLIGKEMPKNLDI